MVENLSRIESFDVVEVEVGFARVQSDSTNDAYPSSEVDAEVVVAVAVDCNYLVHHF